MPVSSHFFLEKSKRLCKFSLSGSSLWQVVKTTVTSTTIPALGKAGTLHLKNAL
jgi:hypothetical protein